MAQRPYPQGLPIIELEGVGLAFNGTEVLRGIDLTVRCGERVVLMGPSGAGKSSLVRCINGLVVPQKGAVRVFGEALGTGKRLAEARLRMEMIFQRFNLYSNRTVLQNVTLALIHLVGMARSDAEAHALEYLRTMDMDGFRDAYPHQLSGGQQQRVALARALAKSPDILLLDEPTSALDPELVRSMLATIERATEQGITTLTVTHELGFARRQARRIVFLDRGQIVEEGTPEAILDAPRSPRLRDFLAHDLGAPR